MDAHTGTIWLTQFLSTYVIRKRWSWTSPGGRETARRWAL